MTAPEGKVPNFLSYWELPENPLKSRDFVHTQIVDRILNEISVGQSIRLSGEAGIGKSATLREIQSRLEERIEDKYVVVYEEFPWLVDKQYRYLTHSGFAVLCRDLCEALAAYKERGGSLPTGTGTLKSSIEDTINRVSEAERYRYFRKLCKKASDDELKIVIELDDCDGFQFFEDFNPINSLTNQVHSMVFSLKHTAETALRRKRKEADQTHTELAAEKDKLGAFLRRSTPVYLEGQTAITTWRIAYGKIAKKDYILTDKAWAYGFAAAHHGRPGSAQAALSDFGADVNSSARSYNPDIMGYYIYECLRIGAERGVKQVDVDIAEEAYKSAVQSRRTEGRVDALKLDIYFKEFVKAREELAKTKKKH